MLITQIILILLLAFACKLLMNIQDELELTRKETTRIALKDK